MGAYAPIRMQAELR